MSVLFRLEVTRILRSRVLVAALLLWVAAAAAAVVNGERIVARQQRVLTESTALQREQHAAVLDLQPPTGLAGDQLYYLAFHTRHHPSAWASLATGRRDQRAFNLKLRILALHGQLYDGEITSPLLGALGALDLAFVLVVLTPLVVIAVVHDLVSGEREGGTWGLVRANATDAVRVLVAKAAARVTIVGGVVVVTTVGAALSVGVPWDARLPTLAAGAALYVCVWATLGVLVATLGRPSSVNALLLLGVWVALVIVGPAMATTAAAAKFPTPEALELTIAQRHGYHGSWDRPVRETMARFTQRYPEWAGAEVPTDRYSNPWYYAMQQRGDDAAGPPARAYRAALEHRHAWVQGWWRALPPAALQAALTRAARTDLPAHLAYLDSVAAFHETLKRHFFPLVFSDRPIRDVRWADAPRHDHADDGTAVDLVGAALLLAAWCAAGLALVALRREQLIAP
jgi:ABC-2 type transport system permease protein